VFKQALQPLFGLLELEMRIVHYPLPRNPWQGPEPPSGLKATVAVLSGSMSKAKVAVDFLANRRIIFDEHLPRWNYRAIPAGR